jgi:urea transporter
MHIDVALRCAIAAAVANGVLVGATLDQSVKQLPARHRIGALAYAAYARAADLAGGLRWYPTVAGVVVLGTGAAVAAGLLDHPDRWRMVALLVVGLATVAHMLVTARAAPTILALRRLPDDDPDRIAAVLQRFARLQTLRAGVQVAALAAAVWVLVATVATG